MAASPLAQVSAFYAAFGRGDTQTMAAALAPDVAWSVGGSPDAIPWAGTASTRDAAMAAMARWADAVETLASQREPPIQGGAFVVVRGTGQYRVRKTGRVVQDRWIHVWRVQGPWIVSFDEYSDTAAAAWGCGYADG